MKAYFISGLAADSRVFRHIQLPQQYEPIHLEWIKPKIKEPLPEYAARLSEPITDNEDFVVIGLSMGGMIASEIAKIKKPQKTILISSVPCSKHLPVYFKVASALQLHKLVPISMVKSSAIAKRFFTTETAEDKVILKDMIRKSDSEFIRWAMDAILNWKQYDIPENLVHLHGTADRLLPASFTKPTHIIKNGSHLLVMDKADEVNRLLGEVLG